MKINNEQFEDLLEKTKRISPNKKVTEEEFTRILSGIKKKIKNKKVISDIDFTDLISKIPVIEIKKLEQKTIKKTKAVPTIPLYKKLVELYEEVIENRNTPKTIIKEIKIEPKPQKNIKWKEIDGLEQALLDINTKLEKYLQYNIYSSGGLSVVNHDNTLSGEGTPQNPLKVVSGHDLLLQTNGVDNTTQTLLNLVAGTNIIITDDGMGNITFDATGGGGGSPGGNQYDVQLNDGAGGFAGSDNLNFQGGYLTINGDSGYGQLQWLNSPLTGGYAGSGISGVDNEIIVGALAGDMTFWSSQAMNFSADTGNTNMLRINTNGTIDIGSLASLASQFVIADLNGELSSQALLVDGVTITGDGITTPLTATTGGGGTVDSVIGTTNRITVDSTDPANPIIDISGSYVGQSSITTLGTITAGIWHGTAIANANLANSSLTIGSTNIALGATSTTLAGLTSVTSTTFVGALTGNADTATSAAKWTTARNLAGNSVDGSANVAFANKFIVQGTADAGLSAAQFLGALGTGILKNTTTTGILSIASDGSDYLSSITGITVSQSSSQTLGDTSHRLTKLWVTDITVTNAIAGSITGNAGTATVLATGRTISITGDLVYTSPSFDGSGNVTAAGTLATVNTNTGSWGTATQVAQFTVNGKGLITAAANVTITPAVGSITGLGTGIATWLATPSSANLLSAQTDKTGTGLLVFGTSPTLTTAVLGSSTATTQSPADNSTKVATTAYVDAAVLGQNFKEAALVATTANLVGAYLAGVFTYTATGTNTIDGVTLALGNRVLVKNQITTFQNGWYVVTTAGAIGIAGVLTRSSDANTSAEFRTGDSSFVSSGTVNSNTTWAYNGVDSPTLGTDAITYAQTAGQGTVTSGNGITVTGLSVAIDTSVTVDKTTVQTLTNKTLTAPIINAATLGTSLLPTTDNAMSLGSTTKEFSNLYLAAGGTINWGNGSTVFTEASGVMTMSGNTFLLSASGTSNIINSRGAITNFALNVFRTASTDEWTMGLRNDSTNKFYISDAVNGINIIAATQGATPLVSTSAVWTFTPIARTTGATSYLTINMPADTGITTATESKGINIVGATRTWADGTVATQREYFFGAPTYNKTTTSATFTNLGTLVIGGAPIAGTGVTLTHPWALWVQAGNSHFGSQVGATQAAVGGTGAEFVDTNNTTGGQTVNVQNTNAGTSAFAGVALGNNQTVDGGGTAHFAGMFFNSNAYSDTTFGTAFAVASQFSLQNTDGPITIAAENASGFTNFVVGGSAATNEVGKFTTAGLTVGLAGTLTGLIKLPGSGSGTVSLSVADASGTHTIKLPTADGAANQVLKTNGSGQWGFAPAIYRNASIASQGAGFSSDTYVTNSNITIPTPIVKSVYRCLIDVAKTNAGTATPILIVRIGTNGSTSDAAALTFTFNNGTAATDVATFEVFLTFRTVGSSTSAVVQGTARIVKSVGAVTGFVNTVSQVLQVTSAGFDSTVASTIIGISLNGGTSASWTIQNVQSEFIL